LYHSVRVLNFFFSAADFVTFFFHLPVLLEICQRYYVLHRVAFACRIRARCW